MILPPSADLNLLPTFADGTNTPGISAPGEPGLSSTHVGMSRNYSPFHVCFVHHYMSNYNIHLLYTALVEGFQIWKVFNSPNNLFENAFKETYENVHQKFSFVEDHKIKK